MACMTHECLRCGEMWHDNLPHPGWCPRCGENLMVFSSFDEPYADYPEDDWWGDAIYCGPDDDEPEQDGRAEDYRG